MQTLNENTVVEAVVAQMATTPNPRFKEIMNAAVRHLHGVGRVKTRPVIQQPARLRCEATGLRVKVPDKILHLAIRRHEENPLVAKPEKVGALGRAR